MILSFPGRSDLVGYTEAVAIDADIISIQELNNNPIKSIPTFSPFLPLYLQCRVSNLSSSECRGLCQVAWWLQLSQKPPRALLRQFSRYSRPAPRKINSGNEPKAVTLLHLGHQRRHVRGCLRARRQAQPRPAVIPHISRTLHGSCCTNDPLTQDYTMPKLRTTTTPALAAGVGTHIMGG